MARWICGAMVGVAIWTAGAMGRVVTFEDVNPPTKGYWDGSDGSGGFHSGAAFFKNLYTQWPGGFGSWEGWAYSNQTDTTAQGWPSQYNAIPGKGEGGSEYYGVAYFFSDTNPVCLDLDHACLVKGLYVTNTNWAYYWMVDQDINGSDTFLLTITGRDAAGNKTGEVEFYLADFRPDDPKLDTLVKDWTWVDLRSLGTIKSLEFVLTCTDVMTPTYLAMDTLVLEGLVEPDTGIYGFVDPTTFQPADPRDPNAVLHPVFRGWATGVARYQPSDDQWMAPSRVDDPNKALGPVTGDGSGDIVSLGDLSPDEIAAVKAPGSITLLFGDPDDPSDPRHIGDGAGFDLVVFENAFSSQVDTLAGSVSGQMLAELAFVEVSTNGMDFVRFPSLSLTDQRVGAYGTIDVGRVQGLAGRYPNGYGQCMGTAFDLQVLAGDPLVTSCLVDLHDIRYVRIVDVPGSGDFLDQAMEFIDPCSGPDWTCYDHNHPIYDQWWTWGSGGFDLEAVGVLHPQQYKADIDLNGQVDQADRDLLMSAWGTHLGEPGWIGRANLNGDWVVDQKDLDILEGQWMKIELWRSGLGQ